MTNDEFLEDLREASEKIREIKEILSVDPLALPDGFDVYYLEQMVIHEENLSIQMGFAIESLERIEKLLGITEQ